MCSSQQTGVSHHLMLDSHPKSQLSLVIYRELLKQKELYTCLYTRGQVRCRLTPLTSMHNVLIADSKLQVTIKPANDIRAACDSCSSNTSFCRFVINDVKMVVECTKLFPIIQNFSPWDAWAEHHSDIRYCYINSCPYWQSMKTVVWKVKNIPIVVRLGLQISFYKNDG